MKIENLQNFIANYPNIKFQHLKLQDTLELLRNNTSIPVWKVCYGEQYYYCHYEPIDDDFTEGEIVIPMRMPYGDYHSLKEFEGF